jgi:hydroxyacylglutathione hydrolase
LNGGVDTWKKSNGMLDTIASVSCEAFATVVDSGQTTVLDVRKPSEYDNGHVVGANNVELAVLNKQIDSLDKNKSYHIHCAGGYRSMMAASIMKAKGFNNIVNVSDGYNKIKLTNIKLEVPDTVI